MGDSRPAVSVKEATQGKRNDYEAIRNLSANIIESYPPSEYLYLCMGKSPLAFSAMAKATLGESAAINIPLTGMAKFFPGSTESEDPLYFDNPETYHFRTERTVKRLHDHFDHFIPSEKELAEKRILLVDFADSGASLINGRRELEEYLNKRNPGYLHSIEAFGIARNRAAQQKLAAEGIDSVIPESKFGERLVQRQYRTFAEFEDFDVKIEAVRETRGVPVEKYKKPELRQPKKESFYDLEDALRKKAREDQYFLGFLKQHAPRAVILKAQKSCAGRFGGLILNLLKPN